MLLLQEVILILPGTPDITPYLSIMIAGYNFDIEPKFMYVSSRRLSYELIISIRNYINNNWGLLTYLIVDFLHRQ